MLKNTSRPLYNTITTHNAKNTASFHTPGHKIHANFLNDITTAFDTTELPDTGSLFDGNDAIEVSEKLSAVAFNAGLTLFSAGGCTLCIQTMLALTTSPGGSKVIMARHSHGSAIRTAALLDINPIWLWSEAGKQTCVEDVKAALVSNPSVKVVYLTSPDYYGNLADIPAISAECQKFGAKLLVDNAHGSHLGAFNLHPLSLGADITADSAHKTLPVLTGGAFLHFSNRSEYSYQRAKSAMALFASTSPSFMTLTSLELAREWWEQSGKVEYKNVAVMVNNFTRIARARGIAIPQNTLRDPARLTLNTSSIGMTGKEAAEYFRANGCEPEYSDSQHVVFIITPFNTPEELSQLGQSIAAIPVSHPLPCEEYPVQHPDIVMTPRTAMASLQTEIQTIHAAGETCAIPLCPCPPGIPILMPGEKIQPSHIPILLAAGYERLNIVAI